MITQDPRNAPAPTPKVEPPRRVVPEWIRRRNAGQLQVKDMTGTVTA